MRTGRPTPELKLVGHQRETLEAWTRRPKSAQALALRGTHGLALCRWANQH
jgi:hypothetical protein